MGDEERVRIGANILSQKLQLRAKEELNETEENINEGLDKLRKWIEEGNLKCSKEKDFLMRFLRVKKYKVEDSFSSISHYMDHFSGIDEQLGLFDAELIKKALEKKVCVLLPYRDSKGRAILVHRAGLCLEEEVEPEDALKAFVTLCYYLLEDPATQIGGVVLIMDVEKFDFSETPYAVEYARVLISLIRSYPARFQRIDVVNEHMIFSTFMSLIKPFLPTKISQRIIFHGKPAESFMKNYEPWMLPELYGGTLEALDNEHFMGEIDRVIEKINNEICTFSKKED